MSSKLLVTSGVVNFVDLATQLLTTSLIYKNTKRAKKTILLSTIAMSTLAVSVSLWQTTSIRKDIKKNEQNLKDVILRNQQ